MKTGELINKQETLLYIFNLFDISFYILYTDKTNNEAAIYLLIKHSLRKPLIKFTLNLLTRAWK